MSSIIFFLLTTSGVGAIVLCIVIALQPATSKVFSKTWHYYMGLVPAAFFLGGAGIVNMMVGFVQPFFSLRELSGTYVGTTVMSTHISAETYYAIVPVELSAIAPMGWVRGISGFMAIPAIMPVLILIWTMGVFLFAAINIVRYRSYRCALMLHAYPCTSVESPIRVLISKKVATPMIIGFVHPVILLPEVEYCPKELEMILAHELVHFRRKDTWLKLIILVVNAVHWFNPAAYMLARYMNDLCELSCDEVVVMEMDAKRRKVYGETILYMLHHGIMQRSVVCASALCDPSKDIKRRLTEMVNVRKTKKIMVALSLALALLISGVGSVVAYGLMLNTDIDGITISSPTIIPADYVINDNIVVEGSILHLYGQVNGTITIGQSGSLIISGSGQVNGMVIVNGNLYLSENGLITGEGTRGVVVNHDGVFVMNGGYIRGNSYAGYGGGVLIDDGKFTMYDGYIVENTARYGGGVAVRGTEHNFTIHGGQIANNAAFDI